jgi:hypothetical protein
MTMYNESDWSSLSVAELLEKAQEFAKKAYGNALSSYSFIDHALDRMPRETKGGAELAELMAKARQVYQTIVEIQQSITHHRYAFPIKGFSLFCVNKQLLYAVAGQ